MLVNVSSVRQHDTTKNKLGKNIYFFLWGAASEKYTQSVLLSWLKEINGSGVEQKKMKSVAKTSIEQIFSSLDYFKINSQ